MSVDISPEAVEEWAAKIETGYMRVAHRTMLAKFIRELRSALTAKENELSALAGLYQLLDAGAPDQSATWPDERLLKLIDYSYGAEWSPDLLTREQILERFKSLYPATAFNAQKDHHHD